MKAIPVVHNETNQIVGYTFFCPGCKRTHTVWTAPHADQAVWQTNGDTDKPTFSPSLLVWPDEPQNRCHSFIKDGNIQFLGDCFHELKNKTVELPEIKPE
jgi:hypothetical protein